jgi:MoaA/NifB/PqqE/SkfB family radical SAM enzyme
MSTIRPASIRLEASSICQLRCPSCPTSTRLARPALGWGFLTLKDFRRIVIDNRRILHAELSNYGEILLNPELLDILRTAYRSGVTLSAGNGVNLNNVKPALLEGLVKYRLRRMTCSIDGASQETYERYRVGGDLERVLSNIRSINSFKRKYRSRYPLLRWQFVVFGHNEHEIEAARDLAKELNMEFKLKLSWDPKRSPVRDGTQVRREIGAASRDEFKRVHGRDYATSCCDSLWIAPQINWNGDVLGCARNFWGSFGGNALEQGVDAAVNSETMRYARDMLTGRVPSRDDIPCASCDLYLQMRKEEDWLVPPASASSVRRVGRAVKRFAVPRSAKGWTNRMRERVERMSV